MKILEIYGILVNFSGILLVLSDKKRARQGAWRIRERTFFLITLLGGGPGTYIAMRFFRHKTRHRRFMVGLPLIMLGQTAAIIALWHAGWFSAFYGLQ